MFSEFKAFIDKGNAMDLAVGVIIGAAFGKIVDSLVNDIIMPVVGLLTGGIDFSEHFIALNHKAYANLAAAKADKAAVLAYGSFFTVVLNFVIVAFAIFLIVKQINRMRGTKAA